MTRRECGFRDSRIPQPLKISTRERAVRTTPAQNERNPEPGDLKVPRPTRRDSHRTNNERPKKNKPLLSSRIGSQEALFFGYVSIFCDFFHEFYFGLNELSKFFRALIFHRKTSLRGPTDHFRIVKGFLYGRN
jgi:hypothetical protein